MMALIPALKGRAKLTPPLRGEDWALTQALKY